jgi:hypothetical protein
MSVAPVDAGPDEMSALQLMSVRDSQIPALLAAATRKVLSRPPTVVAFTATFNQVCASLALAARIK